MSPSADALLKIGIPPLRVKVCWWCSASYAHPQQIPEMLAHQKERHGYIAEKPRVWRGALRSGLFREAVSG